MAFKSKSAYPVESRFSSRKKVLFYPKILPQQVQLNQTKLIQTPYPCETAAMFNLVAYGLLHQTSASSSWRPVLPGDANDVNEDQDTSSKSNPLFGRFQHYTADNLFL